MATGTIVKMSMREGGQRPTTMFWLVATDDPAVAIKAIRESSKPGSIIEVDGPAPVGLVERQKLAPGQACPL